MSTLFAFAPAADHTHPRHPENADRATSIHKLLRVEGILSNLLVIEPTSATNTQLMRAHHPSLLDRVEGVSLRGGGMLDADTYATAESFELAALAAGTACAAVDTIMQAEAQNGFIVIRPPGHHAEFRRIGGFCLVNNVAVAARHAQAVYGVSKSMILDFDVHHGNGTQDIFYQDDDILFASIHQYGRFFYPGTGGLQEVGMRRGHGFTLNVPLPEGVGDLGYRRVFEKIIEPKARAFQPEFIFVSAGYDAHWADPLASAALGLRGYAEMSRRLVALAQTLCHGRILFVLEGGYLLEALSYGVLNSIYALLDRDDVKDPLGDNPHGETDVTNILSAVQQLHLIK